jgi:hypothetical protein
MSLSAQPSLLSTVLWTLPSGATSSTDRLTSLSSRPAFLVAPQTSSRTDVALVCGKSMTRTARFSHRTLTCRTAPA